LHSSRKCWHGNYFVTFFFRVRIPPMGTWLYGHITIYIYMYMYIHTWMYSFKVTLLDRTTCRHTLCLTTWQNECPAKDKGAEGLRWCGCTAGCLWSGHGDALPIHVSRCKIRMLFPLPSTVLRKIIVQLGIPHSG